MLCFNLNAIKNDFKIGVILKVCLNLVKSKHSSWIKKSRFGSLIDDLNNYLVTINSTDTIYRYQFVGCKTICCLQHEDYRYNYPVEALKACG